MVKGKTDMAKSKTKKDTALAELIAAAPAKALSELILNLAENDPEIRRECFDYLVGDRKLRTLSFSGV
jgi:recombinational DNA repair ATPase RecF